MRRCSAGPLLPGLVNAHSHAFQRAFAGHAERREAASDDFWSWRDRMYRVALRLSPAQLRDVAAQLYVELLKGGYTQVCEFHYLQHDVDGQPYADPLAMSWALAEAAAETGIGLTLLPVLYERAGFGTPLRDDQRRFRASAEEVWQAAAAIAAAGRPLLGAGLAIHSLRAARPESIAELRRLCRGLRRADPHPRRRADGGGARLRRHHRRAADRMAGARGACSMRAGSSSTPPTATPARSPRWHGAAPASCSARAPRRTSATASPTCPAGSPPACR